jgi:hypothetical protein
MCNCFFPACARPARLHPAGPPAPCGSAAHSKAAHSLQQEDTLGQEQISVLLCWQLQGSPKAASSSAVAETLAALAAPASGSELDSYVVWATNLHLNVVARGRALEIDCLYPPSSRCQRSTGATTVPLRARMRCDDVKVTTKFETMIF